MKRLISKSLWISMIILSLPSLISAERERRYGKTGPLGHTVIPIREETFQELILKLERNPEDVRHLSMERMREFVLELIKERTELLGDNTELLKDRRDLEQQISRYNTEFGPLKADPLTWEFYEHRKETQAVPQPGDGSLDQAELTEPLDANTVKIINLTNREIGVAFFYCTYDVPLNSYSFLICTNSMHNYPHRDFWHDENVMFEGFWAKVLVLPKTPMRIRNLKKFGSNSAKLKVPIEKAQESWISERSLGKWIYITAFNHDPVCKRGANQYSGKVSYPGTWPKVEVVDPFGTHPNYKGWISLDKSDNPRLIVIRSAEDNNACSFQIEGIR